MKKTIGAITIALALVAGAATVSAMPNVNAGGASDWITTVFEEAAQD